MTTQPGVELVPYEVAGMPTALIDGKLSARQRNYFEEQWRDCPAPDVELFFWTAEKYGLNPFGVAQVYGVPRRQGGKLRLITQVGINGLTLIAQRTGEFGGIGLPEWAGEDGQWRSLWNYVGPDGKPKAPEAAKISVTRFTRYGAGLSWGIAMWNESADLGDDGKPRNLWRDKPALMLAKTATANAIRRSFQQEFAELRAEFAPELGEGRARRRATIDELYGPAEPARTAARPSLAEAQSAGLYEEADGDPQPERRPERAEAPTRPTRPAPRAAPGIARQIGNQDDPTAFWTLSRELGYFGQDVAPAVFGLPTMLAWLHSDPSLTWADALAVLQETAAARAEEAGTVPDVLPEDGDAPLSQARLGMDAPVERPAGDPVDGRRPR